MPRKYKKRLCTSFPLHDAPVFERLAPNYPTAKPMPAVVLAIIVPRFGLTEDDIRIGREHQFDRAERDAWSMLRQCPCGVWFLPARRNCTCCCREHYLRFYRKSETNLTAQRNRMRERRARMQAEGSAVQ